MRSPEPFRVGNPGGAKAFVHVLDEITLNVVLQELDTIGDFAAYLNAREKAFVSETLFESPSEEDLLAVYLKDINEVGEHDFVSDSGKSYSIGEMFVVQEGSYLQYTKRGEYIRKKKADKRSYLWDTLIESFANHFVQGTLAPVPSEMADIDGRHGGAEIGLRFMALERRIMRRAHSEAILGAFKTIQKSAADRFFRAMLPDPKENDGTAFFILLLKRHGRFAEFSYEEYRRFRAIVAHAYSQNLLERNRHLRRVIGIATEGEYGKGRSEDLIYQEPPDWTPEAIEETRQLAVALEVFQNFSPRTYSAEEYPKSNLGLHGSYPPVPYRFIQRQEVSKKKSAGGNRAQRRASKARKRREKHSR